MQGSVTNGECWGGGQLEGFTKVEGNREREEVFEEIYGGNGKERENGE